MTPTVEKDITYHCDRSEMLLEFIQGAKKINRTGSYYLGLQIQGMQFPGDIQGNGLSEPIFGTVMKIWETRDTAYMAIQDKTGQFHVVCLG